MYEPQNRLLNIKSILQAFIREEYIKYSIDKI